MGVQAQFVISVAAILSLMQGKVVYEGGSGDWICDGKEYGHTFSEDNSRSREDQGGTAGIEENLDSEI